MPCCSPEVRRSPPRARVRRLPRRRRPRRRARRRRRPLRRQAAAAGDTSTGRGPACGRCPGDASGDTAGRGAARRSVRGPGRRRRTRRAGRSAAPTAPAAAQRDAETRDADRLGDRAFTGSARRPEGRLVGCGTGRLEHAAHLDDAADRQGARGDAFGPGIQRQVRDPGALQRLRHLRHLESREADARAALSVPRVAERRVGLQEPAVHVVRVDDQPDRLRLRRRARAGQQASRARHPRVRHRRHQETETRHERGDVPRLAHAHRRGAAGRHRQRLHLCLGDVAGPIRRGVAGMPGWRHRRSEHRALPAGSDQGPAGGAGAGGDRELAARVPGPAGGAAQSRA